MRSAEHDPAGPPPERDALTRRTREFLDRRFARGADGGYLPHQPVRGLDGPGEPGQLLRLARSYRLISWIGALQPASLIDLGAAEGYIANLARLRCNCATLCVDLSVEACRRAAEVYGQPSVVAAIHNLPLRRAAADVVVLSEVFEHLPDPLEALNEALRVARRYLVFSTQELCAGRYEQLLHLALRDPDQPHTELNHVTRADLRSLFDAPLALAPQFRRTRRRLLEDVPPGKWEDHLRWLANPRGWRTSEGVLMVVSVDGSPVLGLPEHDDPELWRMLVDGPPVAAPQEPPWDWLEGVDPPQTGLVVDQQPPVSESRPLHDVLSRPAAERLTRRLALPRRKASAGTVRLLSMLVRLAERVGYLACGDPLRTKVNWLMRRPLDR